MNAAARLNTQFIGALPVITQYFERLHLADTLNQAIPGKGLARSAPWPRS
jgi:hypothetical protein